MIRIARPLLLGASALVLLAGCDLTGSSDQAPPADLLPTAHGPEGYVGVAGQPLPAPIGVSVTDAEGNYLRGVAVIFSTDPGSGTVSPNVVITDRNGIAETNWTLGPTPGEQVAVATAGEVQMRFEAIALSPP